MTKYYGVIGNRDHIKIDGEKRPFWEFLDRQPDGFLSSLAYMPIPFGMPEGPKIADCGAWSYKAESIPKLGKNLVTPEWTIQEYQKYFSPGDLVVAPDHMLIPLEGVDLDDRRKFNLESAKAFLPLALAAGFRPMATVHGMDLEERLQHLESLIGMGYTAISFGGMAARASQKRHLLEMIQAMSDRARELRPDIWIHVLGLSSPDYFAAFESMGIDSCDGSSHFKQAFTAGAFFQVENGKLKKYQAGRQGEKILAPLCNCKACSKLRAQGIDTRQYGSNENNMGRAAHNLNMLMQAQAIAVANHQVSVTVQGSENVVHLVSCVGLKRHQVSKAKDLYQSIWFKKARKHVEQCKGEWFILSALYGLVPSEATIEPYEKTLNTMSAIEIKVWAERVFSEILKRYPDGATFNIYAGTNYRKYLVPLLESAGYKVEVPLLGLGIGKQQQWFDLQSAQDTQLALGV